MRPWHPVPAGLASEKERPLLLPLPQSVVASTVPMSHRRPVARTTGMGEPVVLRGRLEHPAGACKCAQRGLPEVPVVPSQGIELIACNRRVSVASRAWLERLQMA